MKLKNVACWSLISGCALVALTLAIVLALNPAALVLLDFRRHPSDARMSANFQKHRADFEQLRAMMQQDAVLTRVAPAWVRPVDYLAQGISEERISEYRRLFRKLGLRDGIEAWGDRSQQIDFLASDLGLAVSGSGKGYAWRTTPPTSHPDPGHLEQTTDDLDALVAREQERVSKKNGHVQIGSAYRHIEGNWYLSYSD